MFSYTISYIEIPHYVIVHGVINALIYSMILSAARRPLAKPQPAPGQPAPPAEPPRTAKEICEFSGC